MHHYFNISNINVECVSDYLNKNTWVKCIIYRQRQCGFIIKQNYSLVKYVSLN